MTFGFHRVVTDQGSDGLLDVALDRVSETLRMGLGIGSSLSSLSVSLLGGTLRGHGRVSDRVTERMLGASEVRLGGVGESVSHGGREWLFC